MPVMGGEETLRRLTKIKPPGHVDEFVGDFKALADTTDARLGVAQK
jgi:hypothetical protein